MVAESRWLDLVRKKQQSPPAVLQGTDLLTAPVDLAIFDSLIKQEIAQRGSHKLSMEAVSFTQQKPLRVVEHSAIDAVSSGVDFSNMSGGPSPLSAAFGVGGGGGGFSDGGVGGNVGELGGTAAASFQRTNAQESSTAERSTVTPAARPHTVNDPFYLNSGPASMMDTEISASGGAGVGSAAKSGFGMIELGDAEESDDEVPKKSKKKHRKKSKGSAAGNNTPASANSVGMLAPAMGDVMIDDSDDEGDDDEPRRRRKPKPGKEFSGLAKVDPSKPLREDEVMPERKHRVAPDRSFEDAPTTSAASPSVEAASSRKEKKKKKKKESKRHKNEQQMPSDSGGVGDLLDLGGFTSDPQSSTGATAAPATSMAPSIMSIQPNPINGAFDDLLGLSMPPAPAPAFLPQPQQAARQCRVRLPNLD